MRSEELWPPDQSAAYCGLTRKYLMRQLQLNQGPTYLMPSPRKILFRKCDLDAWIESWERRPRPRDDVVPHHPTA